MDLEQKDAYLIEFFWADLLKIKYQMLHTDLASISTKLQVCLASTINAPVTNQAQKYHYTI